MRTYYYALETRPLCPKCKVPYAAQIARGSGPGSLTRVLVYGGGAALGCALLLGIGVLAFGYLRVIAAVGIGFAVGRAVNYASGSFFDTRYRVIAAVFTYAALGLGSLAPVIRGVASASDQPVIVAVEEDEDADDDANPYADMDLDEIATAMEEDREAAQAAAREMPRAEREEAAAAQELASKPFISFMGTMLILLVTLPLLANFAFGLYAGAFGALAMGYGVYKAWEITGNSVGVLLSGPHRVGTGPVPHTQGG
jgi:hypothetical protein